MFNGKSKKDGKKKWQNICVLPKIIQTYISTIRASRELYNKNEYPKRIFNSGQIG
jgi:hypothetical protein